MKAREFFLMLLIIGAGVVLFHYDSGELENWTWSWEWEGSLFRTGHFYTFQESGEVPAPFSPALEVVNDHGSVTVMGGDGDDLSVELEKRIWRRKEEDARQIAESLTLGIKDDGQKVLVTVNDSAFRRRNFETHLTLSVPAGLKVTVRNSYGPVKIARTGDTVVDNPHGAVDASDVRGTLSSENSYEEVRVEGVASDCSLRGRHAEVTASRVQGRLRVEQAYGSVRVEDAAGDVTITAPHSRVTGMRLQGEVKVESSYNDVSLMDVGAARISCRNTDIRLQDVRGDVDISNTYGRVGVQEASGKVVILGQNMEVVGQDLSGPEISVTTSYRDILLSNFSGKTTVSQKHAGLRLEPSAINGDILVEAEYCPIELAWPSSSRSHVECRTRNARINWRLAVPPSLNSSNGQSLLKAFPQEEGKPSVRLSTSYADITVTEAPPAGRPSGGN